MAFGERWVQLLPSRARVCVHFDSALAGLAGKFGRLVKSFRYVSQFQWIPAMREDLRSARADPQHPIAKAIREFSAAEAPQQLVACDVADERDMSADHLHP